MTWVAVAVGGSALVGGIASKNAADKASDATKKGLKQSGALSAQSRTDAINLYNQGKKSAQTGLGAAFDFYKKSAPARYSPITQSNAAAQEIIGQGAVQANNAILGMPVDMSFAQPQQINPNLSFLGAAQLPQMDAQYVDPLIAEREAAAQAALLAQQNKKGGGSSNKLDPLGIDKLGVTKKIDKDVKKVGKAIKKLF